MNKKSISTSRVKAVMTIKTLTVSSDPIIGKIVTVDDLLPKVTEIFRDTKHQHRLFHTPHRLTPVMSIVSICEAIWDMEQSNRATCVASAPANFIDGGTLFHPQIFCVCMCMCVIKTVFIWYYIIYIWQVSQQLSCSCDTCQIWMLFTNVEISLMPPQKNDEQK